MNPLHIYRELSMRSPIVTDFEGETAVPVPTLRYLRKGGDLVLQQGLIVERDAKLVLVWQDVPEVPA